MTAAATDLNTASRSGNDFDALAKLHWNDLYRYAYRLAGDKHTAEDLVQESLLRAWKSLHRLKEPGAVKGWLKTIIRRENARRFERIQPKLSEMAPEDIGAVRKDYDTSTEAFMLRRAIAALPAEYRDPLILQVLHGYSQQEIADQLGLSSAGVGTRLFRARQKLREALGEVS
ncbi:MAG: sigma-70 family RNA polymerase sigma factor [Thiohalocapsa sp.]|nr:sigma-70 family RNA polymerase sigma factor [Thiohalocapsa sp.]